MRNKKIYKYVLGIGWENQAIKMPKHSVILSIQVQNTQICVWAEVEENQPIVDKVFVIIGTGHSFDKDILGQYLATVQQGEFVWHIYEGR